MRQVEHFRVDAASRNADILILVTTRPQSYSKEFPSDLFQHLYLMPLSPKEALDYGQRLAKARCGAEERRCDELVRSLERACETEMTARLMQNPLQITIMATLLEETGEPPQQRYRLFEEYYRTIYKRETRRQLLEGILSERRTDIDTIHAEAGLLLHAAGEGVMKPSKGRKSGDSESALSDEQFRTLVSRRLARIGVPEPKASDLVRRISDGSLQRLVFMVRPTEGWIRFDLTPLKEFMAAEALMTGADNYIRERLKAVAPVAYWRNVLLFAVGKCFVEKEYLPASRDTAGWGALPNGAEWYRQCVRDQTTTDLSPEEIHAIGLKEVARIQAELAAVAPKLGYDGDPRQLLAWVRTNPKFLPFRSEAQILDAYRAINEKVKANLPQLFARMPKAGSTFGLSRN